jgi:hypothetical protein
MVFVIFLLDNQSTLLSFNQNKKKFNMSDFQYLLLIVMANLFG